MADTLTEQINAAVAGKGTPVVVVSNNKAKTRGGSDNGVLKWCVISGVVVLVVVVTVILVLKSFEIKSNPNLMLDEKVMENVTEDLLSDPEQQKQSTSEGKKNDVEIELVEDDDDEYDENFVTFDELRAVQ